MSLARNDLEIDIPTLLPSWEWSLKAARRSVRTIQSYPEGARQFSDFLVRRGMPTAVASIRRDHVEAFIVDLDSRFRPAARRDVGGLPRAVSMPVPGLR